MKPKHRWLDPDEIWAALNATNLARGTLKENVLSQKIIGRITSYPIGIRLQTPKECLIEFNNLSSSAAGQIVGHKVVWNKGKNKFTGKVIGLHRRNGMVRVKFARPVPGQAIGKIVELVSYFQFCRLRDQACFSLSWLGGLVSNRLPDCGRLALCLLRHSRQ
jgi:ribosomal protein L35AE/L33A